MFDAKGFHLFIFIHWILSVISTRLEYKNPEPYSSSIQEVSWSVKVINDWFRGLGVGKHITNNKKK